MPEPPCRPGRRGSRRLILTLLLAAGVAACQDINVVTQSYSSLEEARAAGALSAGYLPEGLPPGTYDIREAHDPDSLRRWALFSFPADQAEPLRALLQPQPTEVGGMVIDVPGRVEWWPLVLRDRLDSTAIQATGLETYRTRDRASVVAVNWRQGRAYVWHAAD
jgi:hypothetical protein